MADSAFQDDFALQSGLNWIIRVDSFAVQVHDVASFIAKSLPQESRDSYMANFAVDDSVEEPDVHTKHQIIKDLLGPLNSLVWADGVDKDLEAYALFIHHLLLTSFQPTDEEYLAFTVNLAKSLAREQARPNKYLSRYNALASLFDSLPGSSKLNIDILLLLISTARKSDDIKLSLPFLKAFGSYLTQAGFGPTGTQAAEGASRLLQLEETLVEEDVAEPFLLLVFQQFIEGIPEGVSSDSIVDLTARLVVLAFRSPTYNSFHTIASLPAIRSFPTTARRSSEVELLKLLFNGVVKPPAGLQVQGVTSEQIQRKLQKLAISDLCTRKPIVSYDDLKESLQLEDDDDVEIAVIDALQFSFIKGKLDQRERVLVVESAIPRTFNKDKWTTLQNKLEGVKETLSKLWTQRAESQLGRPIEGGSVVVKGVA